ncbi:MAG: prolyl oligopeptidase family serine peptidase [Thermomicrobiales bacterium]
MTDRALTGTELNHHGKASWEVYTAGFYGHTEAWDFSVRSLLGKGARGGADVGEVLATIAPIAPKDHRGWFDAWLGLGQRIAAIAEQSEAQGHRVSASRAYLRAANYLAMAVGAVDGLDGDTLPLLPTFQAHRAAWSGFLRTCKWRVEAIEIPYEGTTMPGWVICPDRTNEPRGTLIVTNGSDEALSGVWCQVGEGALERGYNVLLFDGPGQQSMLFERNIPFRFDWEQVLTPVVDIALARPDVDPERLAVFGISQGGYWVPRALAFEHRFAAGIVDGGVVDVSRSWFAQLPHHLVTLFRNGDKEAFDREMRLGMDLPWAREHRATWTFRARPYGVTGYFDVLTEVSMYQLGDLASQIETPLFIADADGDQFFAGQPAELAAQVQQPTHVRFRQEEGASYHCQPLARELSEQRMFDWLDRQLDH